MCELGTMIVVSSSVIIAGPAIYFPGVILERSASAASATIPLEGSNNARCVLLFSGVSLGEVSKVVID